MKVTLVKLVKCMHSSTCRRLAASTARRPAESAFGAGRRGGKRYEMGWAGVRGPTAPALPLLPLVRRGQSLM
eukprot:SAG11_NODE_1397_length_5032_cov_14.008109_6_plen_72_part_00